MPIIFQLYAVLPKPYWGEGGQKLMALLLFQSSAGSITNCSKVLLLMNAVGDTICSAHTVQETPLTPGENDSTVTMPFNAHSGSRSATGRLVYGNYATIVSEFDWSYLHNQIWCNLPWRQSSFGPKI